MTLASIITRQNRRSPVTARRRRVRRGPARAGATNSPTPLPVPDMAPPGRACLRITARRPRARTQPVLNNSDDESVIRTDVDRC